MNEYKLIEFGTFDTLISDFQKLIKRYENNGWELFEVLYSEPGISGSEVRFLIFKRVVEPIRGSN